MQTFPNLILPARADRRAPLRMLWLPGAYHSHLDFWTAGFAKAVSERNLDIDLSFTDLDMEFIGDRRLIEKLRNEYVLPARALGVQTWLGGISLGGLFALDYADSHPGELDGLCVLAPYLGNRIMTAEIAALPSLAAWQPGEPAESDVERRIWRHLKCRANGAEVLHLGYGSEDRFAFSHALMARELPPRSVDVVAGGHDWRTWLRLWEKFLDTPGLPRMRLP